MTAVFPAFTLINFQIHYHKQIDSTNALALREARNGIPEGSVFVADYQTHGRGKWGRTWESAPGDNLLFSLLLRPVLKASKAAAVTQISCRSVAKVLERDCGIKPAFKRPNDLLVKGKKICGVLVEAQSSAAGQVESLVIGVGLNVNSTPEAFADSATSIKYETGKKHSRKVLLAAILGQLQKDLNL